MISGLPMPDAVTVLVSLELLAQLEADWTPPVQIHITRTPGIGSGYEMTARTHTCPEHTVTDAAVDAAYDVLDQHGHNGLDCRPRPGFDLSVREALDAAAKACKVCG